jgi:hypothetical protein
MIQELLESLSKGVVCFRYTKADGTIREAIGTTKWDLVPPFGREGYERHIEFLKKQAWVLHLATLPNEPIDTVILRPAIDALRDYLAKDPRVAPPKEGFHTYYDFTVAGWRMFAASALV